MNDDKQNEKESDPDHNPWTDRPYIPGPALQRSAADSALFDRGGFLRNCVKGYIRVIGQGNPEFLTALPEKGMFKAGGSQQTGVASLRYFQLPCQLRNAISAGLRKHGPDQQADGNKTDFSLMPEAFEQNAKKLQRVRFCDDNLIGQNTRDAGGNLFRLIITRFRNGLVAGDGCNPHHRFLNDKIILDLKHGY